MGAGGDLILTSDGTNGLIYTNNGNLTLDVAGDIILDADGSEIIFADGGTSFGKVQNSSSSMIIESVVSDKDILFYGNDGGSSVLALTLDMSNAGYATFNSGLNSGGVIELPQKASFPATGFVHYTNSYVYAFGGVQGSIFKDRTGVTEFLKLQPSQIVFNEDGVDMDFRVESDSNANMLFVDASANAVSVGMATVPKTFNVLGSYENAGFYRDITASGVGATYLNIGRKDANGAIVDGLRISGGGDNNVAASHNGYFEVAIRRAGAFIPLISSYDSGGSLVVNEGGGDVDFRVESDGNDHMLFVDGGANVVNIGHATNTVGTSSGTLMVGFAGNVANGIKLRDSRGEAGTNNAMVFVRGDAEAGAITTTTAPATQYTSASDERLKENIADADDASSKIDAIKVRKYDWKGNGSHQDFGLIAQELQPIAPDAVAGDPDSEKMMSVDYAKLVPMLIKEIQTLRARVADLES
jgi:hypothetical protein